MNKTTTKRAVEMTRQFPNAPAHSEIFDPEHLHLVKKIARRSRDEVGYTVTLRYTTVPASWILPDLETVAERAAS